MAAKESKINNIVVASEDSRRSKEEDDENETRIDLGISFDKIILRPKKKLLVLPLRGFIVHRAHLGSRTIPNNRLPDFSYEDYLVYKRPYCEDFLKFCFERFEVGLWSSSIEDNLENILTNIVGELKSKFLFTWDQNQCTKTEFMFLENKKQPVLLKELKQLWKNRDSSLPWYEGEYSSSNTLLITDPVKALANPPNTAIFPEKYDAENMDDDFLGRDGELRVFLDGVAEAEDVQSYVEDHPFGEPAVSPSHSDWDYYSEILYCYEYEETVVVDKNWDYYSKVMLSFGRN
ncbi:unnamed protein product [Lactuca virosa]|uniref:Mitochondrial import inner membrane translocase subunit TIM50 n=1 Tax=Lactuca virosa TaxID=75947 RepID=A0AAU9NWC3_9ASTR|nr:unnamed protein product [Lactuca virosa]